ncbi:MAG: glycoside hydrolase [bacterium]
MSRKPINIAFLWHMHQPVYTEPDSNVAIMPWTRLHAYKDYADLPLWCEETGFPCTFNMVPCLLDQIAGYADGSLSDTHLKLCEIPIEELSRDDRGFIVSNFFAAHETHMINRHPRYKELLLKRGRDSVLDSNRSASFFDNQEILDLTVLHNLAWFGEHLRENPEVKELIEKGRSFTEEERARVLEIGRDWIGSIIPLYKRLWHEGLIELSCSPYYHPILPLLCRTTAGKDAEQSTPMPNETFRAPDDARNQIHRGLHRFEEFFGKKPRGMWPSEGSVSEDILPILKDTGIKWIATDEAILHKSLQLSTSGEYARFCTASLYQPYQVVRKSNRTDIFFRDHRLSDKIGFDYSGTNPEDAVNDFMANIERIHHSLQDDSNYLVPIILDGENAWEHFPENGREFLTLLFKHLVEADFVRPVTFGGFLDEYPDTRVLERLAAGSWINGDFQTWIGAPEKNRAWEELIRAHNAYSGTVSLLDDTAVKRAYSELLVAEGSDWFWWFGDTNFTPFIEEFDILFRSRLRAVYKNLGLPIPKSLDEPIYSGSPVRKPVRPPLELFTPHLDGRSTDYYEWAIAGLYEPSGFSGAMHGGMENREITRLYYGFDRENLYIRIDTSKPARNLLLKTESIAVEFPGKKRFRLVLTPALDGPISFLQEFNEERGNWRSIDGGVRFAADDVVEMAIPFKSITAEPGTHREFFAYLFCGDKIVERFPSSGHLQTEIPGDNFDEIRWTV